MMHWTVTAIAASLGTLSLIGPSGQAETPKPQEEILQVYPTLDSPQGKCPKDVKVTIQPSPYRAGGYDRSGTAQLTQIVDGVEFEASDRFSVTWRARLKPQYRSCVGTAGLVSNQDTLMASSLLRMRFLDGNAYFILDVTGISDLNNYTVEILQQRIEGGNPAWRWGGTD